MWKKKKKNIGYKGVFIRVGKLRSEWVYITNERRTVRGKWINLNIFYILCRVYILSSLSPRLFGIAVKKFKNNRIRNILRFSKRKRKGEKKKNQSLVQVSKLFLLRFLSTLSRKKGKRKKRKRKRKQWPIGKFRNENNPPRGHGLPRPLSLSARFSLTRCLPLPFHTDTVVWLLRAV